MIGVNTAVIMGAQGICFGGVNVAQHVPPCYCSTAACGALGSALPATRCSYRSGCACGQATQDAGVRVVEVQAGTPAAAAGLQPGDVIVGIDDEIVTGIDDIARVLDGSKIDKRVSARVLREGGIVTVSVTATERLPER